jgi:hypothetical protein
LEGKRREEKVKKKDLKRSTRSRIAAGGEEKGKRRKIEGINRRGVFLHACFLLVLDEHKCFLRSSRRRREAKELDVK